MTRSAFVFVLLVVAARATAADPAPRTDRHGDPLPPGAIARLGTTRLRHVAEAGSGITAMFSPDSRAVLTANEVSLRLWDAETGRLRWQFEIDKSRWLKETGWSITGLAIAPDGSAIAVSYGAGIVLLDLATGKP